MASFPFLINSDLPVVHITSLDAKFRDSVFAMFYAKQSILDNYGGKHNRGQFFKREAGQLLMSHPYNVLPYLIRNYISTLNFQQFYHTRGWSPTARSVLQPPNPCHVQWERSCIQHLFNTVPCSAAFTCTQFPDGTLKSPSPIPYLDDDIVLENARGLVAYIISIKIHKSLPVRENASVDTAFM